MNASLGRGGRPDAGGGSRESRLQAAGLAPERQEVAGYSGGQGQGQGQEGGSGRTDGRQEQRQAAGG